MQIITTLKKWVVFNNSPQIKKKIHSFSKILVFFLIIMNFELNFYLLSQAWHYEPYNWDNRNEIAFKINECITLFSEEENNNKYRIVIIGDSQAESNINPRIIDEFFQHTSISYNLGFYASPLVLEVEILKIILERIKPDLVIWGINQKDFSQIGFINRFPMVKYYNDTWDDISALEKGLFQYSHIYRTNLLSLITWGEYIYFSQRFDRGFWTLNTEMPATNCIDNHRYESQALTEYNEFLLGVNMLKERNISTFLFESPEYGKNYINAHFYEKLQDLTLSFISFMGNNSYNGEFFRDTVHLNYIGAGNFTKAIAQHVAVNFSVEIKVDYLLIINSTFKTLFLLHTSISELALFLYLFFRLVKMREKLRTPQSENEGTE